LKEVRLSASNYERFLAIDGQIFVPRRSLCPSTDSAREPDRDSLRRARRSNGDDAVKPIKYGVIGLDLTIFLWSNQWSQRRYLEAQLELCGLLEQGQAYPTLHASPALSAARRVPQNVVHITPPGLGTVSIRCDKEGPAHVHDTATPRVIAIGTKLRHVNSQQRFFDL
jgi:hypothetical protein